MSDSYKIEKGVAFPKQRNSYPFAQMQVGDSFALEARFRPSVSTLAARYGKETDRKFSVRTDGDGIRVWRVA